MKTQLGIQIKALRIERGVTTTQLAKKGIHPNLPATIEKARKAYTIDSVVNYLEAIAPGEFELRVVERTTTLP